MVDAIIGLFVLAGYLVLGLLAVFVVFWLMVGAYVVAHDITHEHKWKHERDEAGGEEDL